MDLLVAYRDDPAGFNMAKFLARDMEKKGNVFCGDYFDLLITDTPVISADWLGEKHRYDGYVFLSKHAAESGTLALTCHSTGNFSDARFGGSARQVAVPHPDLQKLYMQRLWKNRGDFAGFEITIEATHHGPTSLSRPVIFVEIGTGPEQWENITLCESVAALVLETMKERTETHPFAICLGGTHYPAKFTQMLLEGEYALGTVVPRRALGFLDCDLFGHILQRNFGATAALVDEGGLGPERQRIFKLLSGTDLEVICV